MPLDKAIDNFALFLAQFATFDEDDRYQLVAHYCRAANLPDPNLVHNQIEVKTLEKLTLRGREYLTKIYRDCTQFSVAQNYRSFRAIPRQLSKAPLLHALGDLDSVMSKRQHLHRGESGYRRAILRYKAL